MREGLVYAILNIYIDRTKNEDIGLVRYVFERALNHLQPSRHSLSVAAMSYYPMEPEKLTEIFLEKITDGTQPEHRLKDLGAVSILMTHYIRDAGHFVQGKLSKLK